MFRDKPVLIVEDNLYLALDLAAALEDCDARVVGPASSVAEALDLLDSDPIAAAIVDSHLDERNVAVLTRQLAARRVPFVIYTATPVPPAIKRDHPHVPVLLKPLQPRTVMSSLAVEMRKAAR